MNLYQRYILPYYSREVAELHALDPSPELVRIAAKRTLSVEFPVSFEIQSGETLPFADAFADTVLTTFTLCTIPDALRALREARRVLKPGGRLPLSRSGSCR